MRWGLTGRHDVSVPSPSLPLSLSLPSFLASSVSLLLCLFASHPLILSPSLPFSLSASPSLPLTHSLSLSDGASRVVAAETHPSESGVSARIHFRVSFLAEYLQGLRVCVCVCERERDRKEGTERGRKTEKERRSDRTRGRAAERERGTKA